MGRKQTEETKEKLRKKALEWHEKNQKPKHQYVCEKCGISFESKKIRDGRRYHCNNCKRKVAHVKNPETLLDCSSRTVQKILKRSEKGCVICDWNETACDIHHIIPKSEGGSDMNDNLVLVCPNCHRVIHTTEKYSKDFLFEHNFEKTFMDWKDFYNI